MFNNYSYKTKFKALIVIFCLLGLTAYRRSFSTLLAVISENKNLNEKVSTVTENSKNLRELTAELNSIDKVIGKEGIVKEKIQQDIIDFATQHGGISIHNLQSIHEYSDQNHIVYTNQLDITGDLNQLLSLSYKFEKEFTQSRLVSLNYYTAKKNNNTSVLHLKMIFQNYENN